MREYSLGTQIDIGQPMPKACRELIVARGVKLSRVAGRLVYAQGDAADTVFLLESGRAKSVLATTAGQSSILRIHLAGSLLGLTAFATSATRDADAVIIRDATLYAVTANVFRELLHASPSLTDYTIQLLADRMSDFHHRVGVLAGASVAQRLATILLALSRPDPIAVNQPAGRASTPVSMTQAELAALLGARRPTVAATLSEFQRAGLVVREKGAIVVVDADRLRDTAGG